jgi:hypothetical protein
MAPNYLNGKIYSIEYLKTVDEGVEVVKYIPFYIGSTVQMLCARMSQHRTDSKIEDTPVYTFIRTIAPGGMKGKDGIFRIVLIKKFPCNSIEELLAEEYRLTNKAKVDGGVLYNGQIDGKQSDQAKKKISDANMGKVASEATKNKMSVAKAGSNNYNFNSGCILYRDAGLWEFQYRLNGKRKSKSFASKKYGYLEAELLASAKRKETYPDFSPTPEEILKHEKYILEHTPATPV